MNFSLSAFCCIIAAIIRLDHGFILAPTSIHLGRMDHSSRSSRNVHPRHFVLRLETSEFVQRHESICPMTTECPFDAPVFYQNFTESRPLWSLSALKRFLSGGIKRLTNLVKKSPRNSPNSQSTKDLSLISSSLNSSYPLPNHTGSERPAEFLSGFIPEDQVTTPLRPPENKNSEVLNPSMIGQNKETKKLSQQAFYYLKQLLLKRTRGNYPFSETVGKLETEMNWGKKFQHKLGPMLDWVKGISLVGANVIVKKIKPAGLNCALDCVMLLSEDASVIPEDRGSTRDISYQHHDWENFDSQSRQFEGVSRVPHVEEVDGAAVCHNPFGMPTVQQKHDDAPAKRFFHIVCANGHNGDEHAYQRMLRQMRETLSYLAKTGVLSQSLSSNSSRFESLEWLGDAVLHYRLSLLLYNSQNLMPAQGLTCQRIRCEQRITLSLLFDELHLGQLVHSMPYANGDLFKSKGDCLESIVGELFDKLHTPSGMSYGASCPYEAEMKQADRQIVETLLSQICQALVFRGSRLKSNEEVSILKSRQTQ